MRVVKEEMFWVAWRRVVRSGGPLEVAMPAAMAPMRAMKADVMGRFWGDGGVGFGRWNGKG